MPRNLVRTDRLAWIDLVTPTKAEFRKLSKELGLHPHDASAAVSPSISHSFGRFKTYAFVKLSGPDLSRISLFLTPNFGATIQDRPLPQVSALFRDAEKFSSELDLACEIIRRLSVATLPQLERLSESVNAFERSDHADLPAIEQLQRQIIEFQNAVNGNEQTVERFTSALQGHAAAAHLQQTLRLLAEQRSTLGKLATTIHRVASVQRELRSSKLDSVVRNFSVVSVAIFTMSLGALLLPNPAFRETLFRGPWSFVTFVGLAGLGAILTRLWLKRKPLTE